MDAAVTRDEHREAPRFVTGSTLRHVVVMAASGSVGLVAVFLVDFLSLLYISWLQDPRLTAAIGLATVVLFLATSINVGLMIAVGALVSRALGAWDRTGARRLATSCCSLMAATAVLVTLILLPALPRLLALLGAGPDTLPVAQRFLAVTLPSNVLMALGMGLSGVLRAVGDARRSMLVTLSGAVVTAILDPLLIFGFGLGTTGAAVALVLSRCVFAAVGLHGAGRVHGLLERPRLAALAADARPMVAIAGPAVLTNLAAPAASVFLVGIIAPFGDPAIAANAVVDRLVPVAFGGLFALSGAIGPILGQNWGAGRFDRMHRILRDAVLCTAIYVAIVGAGLAAGRGQVAALFGVTGLAADMIAFFCLISGPVWLFNGLLFTANAAFNNLGFPLLSTAFNWGRATLGIVPLASLGARWAGPEGAFAGVGLGSAAFGLGAIATAFWAIRRRARDGRPPGPATY